MIYARFYLAFVEPLFLRLSGGNIGGLLAFCPVTGFEPPLGAAGGAFDIFHVIGHLHAEKLMFMPLSDILRQIFKVKILLNFFCISQ